MEIREQKIISLLGGDLRQKLNRFKLKLGAMKAGFPDLGVYHPTGADFWEIFPKVPVARGRVYAGNSGFSYSHHHIICKFKDTYIVSWSNGLKHEDFPGQQVHYSWSKDLKSWQPYKVLAGADSSSTRWNSNAGLFASKDTLYAYVGVSETPAGADVEAGKAPRRKMWLDVYETRDLVRWKRAERLVDEIYLFEGPRRTRGGDLLCCGINNLDWRQSIVLVWEKGVDPASEPLRFTMPASADGILPEQGTWYQTEDGEIWMFLRDGSYSTRLGLSWSRDGGKTWSEPHRTDFPNTYSRAHAGSLGNGMYYIVGNNYDHFLDRSHLMAAISDDGKGFDRMYVLLDEPTTRRHEGYHKENGYHYPNCIVDGGRLITVISVNKEDIEVLSADINDLR